MKNGFKTTVFHWSLAVLISFGFSQLHAQVDTSLASSLLKGNLQDFLIKNLAGRLGTITVAEKFNLGTSTVQIASRKIPSLRGTLDQITIKITEKTGTQVLSLVQAADGKLSELRGGQLVAISGGNPLSCISQLFGSASACSACKTKIVNCVTSNNTFLARARCIGRSFDGTCISCGVSLFALYNCLKG